ncbi:MAG: NAD(+) diphosphatase [Geodermatophilaceae bacterium]
MSSELDRRPLLSRAHHDRAGMRRRDTDWLRVNRSRARIVVVDPDYAVPVRETDAGPQVDWRDGSTVDDAGWLFLGEHDGTPYAAVRADRDLRTDQWLGLREVGALLPELEAGLVVQAVALAQWHDRHPFCPVCGRASQVTDAGWLRRCADGHDQFPRTDPAVIMLVHDGADRCVLGRQAVWPTGRFSILAGFVEPGESAEAAVAREVAEEVGVTVTDVRYTGSQPWPFPGSLMLGFTARVTGDPTLHLDDQEIAEAGWFTRAEVAEQPPTRRLPPPVSIAYRIITDWLDGILPA